MDVKTPSDMANPVLAAHDVSVTVRVATLLDSVSLESVPGEVLALVGPNGAGKSTLLSVMSGERVPTSGQVTLSGTPLRQVPQRDLARLRAVMTQQHSVAFGFSVREVVAMARHPWDTADDHDATVIAAALERADVSHLAHRSFLTLSGGEQARVALARCLAQTTPIIMLDEPTAALDLRHQEDVLTVVREHTAAGGSAVVVVHDLSLAGAYADTIAVLDKARLAGFGAPREVLTQELIEHVYKLEVTVRDEDPGPVVTPRRTSRR